MSLIKFISLMLIVAVPSSGQDQTTGSNRIISGVKATEPVPYQISLQVQRNSSQFSTLFMRAETEVWAHTCGGSIIRRSYVLTAAHCVVGGKPSQFSVLAGTLKRRSGGTRHTVEWIKVHPNYQELVMSDIALLKMENPFEYGTNIQSIELEVSYIGADELVQLSGWGYTRPIRVGRLPEDLQMMTYKTLTNKDCNSRGFNVTKTEICTYNGVFRGACAGDSGGPLVNEDRTKQIGIVSYGTVICAVGMPDVFTRVSEFILWITEEMKN